MCHLCSTSIEKVHFEIKLYFVYHFRACLHGGAGPQIGEVTCVGSPHPSRKRDQIK